MTEKNQRVLLQLQSGYSYSKEYQHKTGIAEDRYCNCGEIEDLSHFILNGPNEGPRENLTKFSYGSD